MISTRMLLVNVCVIDGVAHCTTFGGAPKVNHTFDSQRGASTRLLSTPTLLLLINRLRNHLLYGDLGSPSMTLFLRKDAQDGDPRSPSRIS